MSKLIAACSVEFCPDDPERFHRGHQNGLDLLIPLCAFHSNAYETYVREATEALGANLTCQGCGFRMTTWAYEPLRARRGLLSHADGQGRCPITGTPIDPA